MLKISFYNIKSVKSIHPCKSVIQTIYNIVKHMVEPHPDSYRDKSGNERR
jgi:hypothetical protein